MPLSISGHSRIEVKLSNEIDSSCSVRLSKYGIYAPGIQFTICLVHACVAIGAGLTDSSHGPTCCLHAMTIASTMCYLLRLAP